MTNNYGQNMLLFSSSIKASVGGYAETFRMLPVMEDCPYVEAFYNPELALLVVVGKESLQQFQKKVKLGKYGEPLLKPKTKSDDVPGYQTEEALMDTNVEYCIENYEEQVAFVTRFAVNAKDFDFEKYLRDMEAESQIQLTGQSLT